MVKYRACLSVGWLIVGVQAQSFAQAVGVTAQSLSGYSAGVSARYLVYSGRRHVSATVVWFVDRRHTGTIIWSVDRRHIGTISWSIDRMHISTISCSGCRRNGTVVIGFIPQAYQHGVLSIWVAGISMRRLSGS